MRMLTLSLILAAAALMTIPDPVSAQSPTTYPWCSRGGRSSANNCYFTSKEQCQRTISGIGAFCLENPYRRHSPPARTRR
jgi:Protein of unknown function (DUF3551)